MTLPLYEGFSSFLTILPSSAQAQAQAQLGAEIALFSQLWGTYTLHPTPYRPGIVVFACLQPYYHNCWDFFMTCFHNLFTLCL